MTNNTHSLQERLVQLVEEQVRNAKTDTEKVELQQLLDELKQTRHTSKQDPLWVILKHLAINEITDVIKGLF